MRISPLHRSSIFSPHEAPHPIHPQPSHLGWHLPRHSGSFTYSVNPGSANKPVTYVSWFDAARFTNWLHNGQTSGLQDATTTERGAYTLDGATSGVAISKNVGATVWIPSENEWYKAAYYDPNKGGAGVGGYWAQATQSNTVTGNTVGVATSANYYDGDYASFRNTNDPTFQNTNEVFPVCRAPVNTTTGRVRARSKITGSISRSIHIVQIAGRYRTICKPCSKVFQIFSKSAVASMAC